jgi:hypothetical protein
MCELEDAGFDEAHAVDALGILLEEKKKKRQRRAVPAERREEDDDNEDWRWKVFADAFKWSGPLLAEQQQNARKLNVEFAEYCRDYYRSWLASTRLGFIVAGNGGGFHYAAAKCARCSSPFIARSLGADGPTQMVCRACLE